MICFRLRRATASAAALAALLSLVRCTSNEPTPTAQFSAPSGLALAGTQFDRVFVANGGSDGVQVLSAGQSLSSFDMVPAPARFFPLTIPVGPSPELIAATSDGAFALVLDGITSTAHLIDADALRLARDANQVPITLPVGPRESQPVALVGAPGTCTAASNEPNTTCIGRSWALLRRPAMVVAIDVLRNNAGEVALGIGPSFAVGGTPSELAVHPAGTALFVTDQQTPEFLRLELDNAGHVSHFERFALGLVGGAISVAADASFVAVARPSAMDVMFFSAAGADVATGELEMLDANPVDTPTPSCLMACGQTELDLCQSAHPADRSLCATAEGYSGTATPYTALYTGSIPRALAALGGNDVAALIESCAGSGPEPATQSYAQGIAIAGLDGSLMFAGLDSNGTPHLLDTGFCKTPYLATPSNSLTAAPELLAPCGSMPSERARISCLNDAAGKPSGVLLLRGRERQHTLGLMWEGTLPLGDRSNGGGAIDEQGRLYDLGAGIPLGDLGIAPRRAALGAEPGYIGDTVEILTPPSDAAACSDALAGETALCALERHVVGFAPEDGNVLVLDTPLPPQCFMPAGSLAYRIRHSQGFLAGEIDDSGQLIDMPVRLQPGESYGPGQLAGSFAPIFFTLDPQLDTGAGASACTLYRHDKNAPGMPAWRSRVGMTTLRVADTFAPLRAGRATDLLGQPAGNLGRMPRGLVVTRGTPARLVMSYAGSDALLVTTPSRVTHLSPTPAEERLIR